MGSFLMFLYDKLETFFIFPDVKQGELYRWVMMLKGLSPAP